MKIEKQQLAAMGENQSSETEQRKNAVGCQSGGGTAAERQSVLLQREKREGAHAEPRQSARPCCALRVFCPTKCSDSKLNPRYTPRNTAPDLTAQ